MSFKNKEIRRIISKKLRDQKSLFKEYDKQNNQELAFTLTDIDDLFSGLREFNKDSNRNVNKHLKDQLELSNLAMLLTGYLSLTLQQEENKGELFDGHFDLPKPHIVLSCLTTQITNHTLSVINLVKSGLDNSARTILRTIEELVYLTIYLASDISKIKVYSDINNPKETWYKNFRLEKINKEIVKIETRLGLPDKLIQQFKEHRSEGFEFYSQYIHNSYGVIASGTFVRSFSDDDAVYNSLFGKESRNSISTLNNVNSTLFYFNLSMFKLLISDHKTKLSPSNGISRMTLILFESFKEIYLNSLNERESESIF
ncbi:hypothetical protein [Paenibacillus sp. LK1]|uniref:hypothetical protein n=1 Tax=Paenibacillus sp. LK1 TaxID=2053014 RepID=UPI000C180AA3|nr:hypothetical protein [Paenibacillus sp. LK1]PIH60055.1 hypothetical protein CS562_09045 [Paenibacillus sp. LK1]